ncbi:hypothetical protein GCK32_007340 [Trichostrongylus colubriformis]|uniref:Dehydrogenase E1 component domain-containing protein n=1 Tax=Trichostrongylus colubriformis TaxID=6319 RepID=A0AAN8FV64_TRICO
MLQLLDSLNSSALDRMSSGSIGAHRLGMADVATEAAPAPAETPAAPAESAPAPAPAPAPAESMETGEAPPPATAPNSAEENAPAAPAAAPAAPASAPAAQPAPAAATDAPKSTGVLAPPRAAPAIPTRQYLDQTVVPILLQALGALAKERPENPIDFLINFLIKEKERYQPSTENHIEDDDVQSIINRLNGYTLEGKNIHIQLSTSKLRSQPGMSNQCFRCASTEHKTPNCPKDPNNQVTQTIKIDLTGAVKRPAGAIDGPDAKRPVQMISMVDEEIPRPPEPELQQLYEEYSLSRQRYTYYRERLQKEIHAKRNGMAGSVYVTPFAPLGTTSTQLSSAAVPYITPQPQAYTQPAAIGGSHPYSLKAPYAAATPQVQQVAPVPQIGAIPAQQTTYISSQPSAVYGAVGAPVQQGLVNVQPQQGLQYATAVQQQQPTVGVQSSAPMTTQQYLQSVGLQQAQQQQQPGAQIGLGQVQQTTLRISFRAYRMGPSEFGHLPDPPKSAFILESGMRPEDSQRVHLINAFRRYGYLQAELDPLGLQPKKDVPELNPAVYGLSPKDALPGKELSLEDLAEQLRMIYCGSMAIEFMHINNWEERQWLAHHFENAVTEELRAEKRVQLAKLMLKCENFDHFLALKFPTVKRYGSEGAESMYGFFSELFDTAPEKDIKQIFVGIAHRGRLNLLTEMMQFPVVQMFRKMRGKPEFPDDVHGSGDVLSHFTGSFDHQTPEGTVHVSMLPNPSHLEAVNPVTMGKARARARFSTTDQCYASPIYAYRVLLSMVNVGTKDVVKATRLAMEYREKFRKDVFINMVCFRRWGHNELDDPSFTQPIMYRVIEGRESVPRQYADELIDQGLLTEDEVKQEKDAHTAKLMESFKAVDSTPPV